MKGLCGGRTPARSEAQGGKVATPERGRPPAEPPCSQARATTTPSSEAPEARGGGREGTLRLSASIAGGRREGLSYSAMMCPP